jgi:hypothetical protein
VDLARQGLDAERPGEVVLEPPDRRGDPPRPAVSRGDLPQSQPLPSGERNSPLPTISPPPDLKGKEYYPGMKEGHKPEAQAKGTFACASGLW